MRRLIAVSLAVAATLLVSTVVATPASAHGRCEWVQGEYICW